MSFDYKIVLNFKITGEMHVEGTINIEPFVDEDFEDWNFETKIKNIKTLQAEEIEFANRIVNKKLFKTIFE